MRVHCSPGFFQDVVVIESEVELLFIILTMTIIIVITIIVHIVSLNMESTVFRLTCCFFRMSVKLFPVVWIRDGRVIP